MVTPVPKPSLEAAPLGVRSIGFVVRHFSLLVLIVVLSTGAGVALGFALPRPFVDRAIVELGGRFMDEPVEHPMVAAARLTGYLKAAAREVGTPEAVIIVENRRGQKTNALTALIEVRVEAETADTTRTIIDRAVGRLVKDHSVIQERELEIMKRQLTQLEASVDRLEKQIESDIEQGDDLAPLVIDAHRAVSGTRSVATSVRMPATRVVRHAVAPEPDRSRLPVTTLGGLVLGVLLGLIAGAWRDAKRSMA